MQLSGKTIVHKTFGKGVIAGVSDNMVTVNFLNGEKKFIYPDAFANFMIFKDATAQKQVDAILNVRMEAETEKREASKREQERRQRLRELRITANAQMAFGLISNEREKVFSDWSAYTGAYASGAAKGETRVPMKLRPNSACLITERNEGEEEAGRRILGVFMVEEDFFGDLCSSGVVRAHEHYRIDLRGGRELLFWDYFSQKDKQQKWGNMEFKYFANSTMQHILLDVKNGAKTSEQKKLAESFYKYFCKINKLDK